MKPIVVCILLSILTFNAYCNPLKTYSNTYELSQQPKDVQEKYKKLKKTITLQFKNETPLQWGEKVSGVKTHLDTQDKVIALTMDACGSKQGMGYDTQLIEFLEKQHIPATLFINARWIDNNFDTFNALASNSLFEIANHGLKHKPASVNGRSIYGLKGSQNIEELIDEIELAAMKIEALTNKRPKYYRSGTAFYDEVAVKVSIALKHEVIGFSILGDRGATYSAKEVEKALLHAKKGEIVIIHMNHPESGTKEGMIHSILALKQKGFKFVKLSDYALK